MKKLHNGLWYLAFVWQIFLLFPCFAQAPNTLTSKELKSGWKILFDGETLTGWRTLGNDSWVIENGMLNAVASPTPRQIDIITADQYDNFELVFDFKTSKHTNSGVKYLVTNNFPEQRGAFLGLEYQILDDVNFQYQERGELRTLGSLYDLIPADEQKKSVQIGKWNTARIIVNNNIIQHWLNGHRILVYNRETTYFKSLITKSKYKNLSAFGRAKKGYLLFQNEGSPISFRNIKIKNL